MQLNELVNFHKTIGDKTRIRIISLLKEGPLHGQAIAGKLGLLHQPFHITSPNFVKLILSINDVKKHNLFLLTRKES